MAPRSAQWPRYLRVAPWLLVAGGMLWNGLEAADYWGDPMVAAAAVLAGALLPLRDTLAVGTANVTGILALSVYDGTAGTKGGYLELVNTVFAALLGVWVNRVVARHSRRLATMRSVAEAAQRAVLPAPPPRAGELSVAACYRAAQTEALIGGDAYAVQETPYGVRVLMADVRGKGLPAVETVSVLLGAFRENASRTADLVALADTLEQALARESAHREEEVRTEGFSTALLVEFTPGRDALRALSCGHPGPYLLDGAGGVRRLDAADPGLPLGMGALGPARRAPDAWPFPAGHTLLLVTDGVTEARDAAGRFYDPVAGLAPLGPFAGPQEALDALVRDVERWTGAPRDDDMAVLAVTRP
ncbi:PP2C family protein-serine/threonine phosphatase [Kitasatospora aureofaciens]|uniref:PP2C family protein-serine/threonine phosphatase n=1 Tax=Kitasatospora aureofaciens TaxID=1894 RepID=UPI001C43C3ED|nr:PP2C family protein-serine/threonine phosphatase [Kitasatospora aureofaciens]MBV6699821.1 serine/threonine-protein phosphatase [Kitasatospora aureofaciens]